MSALALPCGMSTPILKIPSSSREIGTLVEEKVDGGLAALLLQPTAAIINAPAAIQLVSNERGRRIQGL
jgi:hypothetical protein